MTVRLPAALSARLTRGFKRPLQAARAPQAFDVLRMPVRYDDFSTLQGRYALLVTYKRDGTAVPTPVWFARDGEKVYVWTEINAYKAKRLRHDPRALLAPCTARGVPTGWPVAARGRVLTEPHARARAAAVIRGSWGPGRRLLERVSRPVTEVHYLELVPATPQVVPSNGVGGGAGLRSGSPGRTRGTATRPADPGAG